MNPKTGQPIKIITVDTALSRNKKTLVWFSGPAPALTQASWSRWDIGAESIAAAKTLEGQGLEADIVLCLEDKVVAEPWFRSGASSSAKLVIVTKALIEDIGFEEFVKLRLINVLCIDEIKELYGFVGPTWDGSLEDAKTIVALILHTHRSFPVKPTGAREVEVREFGVQFSEVMETPPALWLITQYYAPEKAKRRKEIDACLEKNLANPLIDKVVLLNDVAGIVPSKFAGHAKLTEEVIGKRVTYADVLKWVAEDAPASVIVVFANADIFLDSSAWRSVWSVNMDNQFMCILRWEVEGVDKDAISAAKLFGPRPDSQDTWVVQAKSIQALGIKDWSGFDFPFGKAGCDNAITFEMLRKKFLITNPALTLRTYHYHSSQIRSYDPRDIVDRPFYIYVIPTGIHDMKPVYNVKEALGAGLGAGASAGGAPATAGAQGLQTQTFKPIKRRIKGPITPAQAATFCTMIKKATEVELNPTGENTWTPPPATLYPFKNIFQTKDGLLYNYDSIFLERTKKCSDAWVESQISSLSASLEIPSALVSYIPDAVAKSPAKYMREYLAKIFLLRKNFQITNGEFWCSKEAACIEALKMFKWPQKEIPVISRGENQQTWCKTGAAWFPYDVPAGHITSEEVAALRDSLGLGGWTSTVATGGDKRLVFVVDDAWCTEGVAAEIEAAFEAAAAGLTVKVVWSSGTSLDTFLLSLKGAWGLVVANGSPFAAWSWVLPEGAAVWDIQSEMEPSVEGLCLSSAAGLDHRLVIVPKGAPTKGLLANLSERLKKDIAAAAVVGAVALPLQATRCIVPSRKDFFAHAGDSFREMLNLWEAKGYISIDYSADACQVWLADIGDTLLYDRPTLEWLAAAPQRERAWRIGLFGNPSPPAGGKAWTFWARRPKLVEDAVASGIGNTSFEDRSRSLVFYGKSENAVQRERRGKVDWSSACDEFHHVDGASAAYPLSQMDYLKRLASSRYGLCLAGYGRKCHREIECMAMGCVPVCAPEVDMSGYAEPLQEGVHYFRVKDPEDAKSIVAVTSAATWLKMSNACREWWWRNASVDGSWALTQRLMKEGPNKSFRV